MKVSPTPNQSYIDQCLTYLPTATYDQVRRAYIAILNDPHLDDAVLAAVGRADRYFLLTMLCRRVDALHPWVYERCREVEAATDGRLDLWFRGGYKSTCITFAGAIQEILRNPEITIGIFSHTRPIAKAFLNQIKRELESNEALKRIYPDVLWSEMREAPSWSLDSGIVVRRKGNPKEATVEAWGLVDGQPTSKHFGLLIYDDVVTRESVTTPDQIAKTTEGWELSQNLKSKNGRFWMIGTRYAYADTYQSLIDRGAVTPRVYPATDDGTPDGNPVFHSPEKWAEIKRDASVYVVACQQLQNPVMGSEQSLDPAWLRYWEVRPQTVNVYIMCDPAGSKKKTSDRTALAVIAVDASLNKYLVDGMCHRMKLSERWAALKGLRNKWLKQPGVQIVSVGYEKYGMQSDIEHFQEMMQIEKSYFPIRELSWPRDGTASKVDRVNRLQPDVQNWRFFFPYAEEICVVNDLGEATWKSVGLSSNQKEANERGQPYLTAQPIKYKNEEGRIYNVVRHTITNEYMLFPSIHPDMLDAMSRIYDMEISAPRIVDPVMDLEPPAMPDY